MEKYESFEISNIEKLKQPTIYFYLKENGFSEHYIKNLRKPNSIKINEKIATIKNKLQNGDILQILRNPNPATNIKLCDEKLEILYEDEDYLAVNKPHNLACIPTRSHYDRNLGGMICNYMKNKDENFVLRILNRLDKETAGIVLVAKNIPAYNNAVLHKEYYALCHGNFEEKNFTINRPILTVTENGINQMKRIISPNGKPSITHVEVLENFKNYALIKATLETGRTHQIRVHLSSIGHSLIDDTIYGLESLDNILKQNQAEAIATLSTPSHFCTNPEQKHTFLILKNLSFEHFRYKKIINLQIPFPNDWQDFILKNKK